MCAPRLFLAECVVTNWGCGTPGEWIITCHPCKLLVIHNPGLTWSRPVQYWEYWEYPAGPWPPGFGPQLVWNCIIMLDYTLQMQKWSAANRSRVFFCCVPSGSSNCGGWVQLYFLFWVFRWSPNWAKTTSLPCLKGSLADSLLQVFWAYQLAMILQLSCRSAVAKASCQFGFLIIDACCWMFKWIHTGFIHDGSASAFGRLVITIHWLRKQAHIRVPSVLPVWSA